VHYNRLVWLASCVHHLLLFCVLMWTCWHATAFTTNLDYMLCLNLGVNL
jgi:hypothetical protein